MNLDTLESDVEILWSAQKISITLVSIFKILVKVIFLWELHLTPEWVLLEDFIRVIILLCIVCLIVMPMKEILLIWEIL